MPGGMLGGCKGAVLVQVLLCGVVLVTAQAHFCEIDGRMQFGALMQVLFWGAVWSAV